MNRMRTILLWSLCFLVIAAGAAFAAEKGGVLRVAVIDEPPTLDQHVVTSDLTTMIAQHIFPTSPFFPRKQGF